MYSTEVLLIGFQLDVPVQLETRLQRIHLLIVCCVSRLAPSPPVAHDGHMRIDACTSAGLLLTFRP